MNCLDIQRNKLVILNNEYELIKEKEYENEKVDFFISLPWIDSHVHCNPSHPEIKGNPDQYGVNQGVGYIFDAGSTGIDNLSLWDEVIKETKTNINILLNVSRKGIIISGELKNLEFLTKIEDFKKVIKNIKGLKLRISPTTNNYCEETLEWSIKASKELKIPLMIHVGNAPPNINHILKSSHENVIITHCFNGKKNNLLKSQETINLLKQKIKEGLKLDIGHGSESFAFETVRKAFNNKIEPFSISTDMYINNFEGPVFSLANVMSKLLYFGYSKEKILDCVTKNPAELFNIKQYPKSFKDGFTLFKIIDKEIIVKDAVKNMEASAIKMKKIFVPKIIKHNNIIFKVEEETLYGKPL